MTSKQRTTVLYKTIETKMSGALSKNGQARPEGQTFQEYIN